MKLVVLADCHIYGTDDPFYLKVIELLNKRLEAGDICVLAGDIFDFFVGEKEALVQEYSSFVQAVTEAGRRGVYVHYIEGNHDFMLKRAFGRSERVFVHAHEINLLVEGRKFYFAHGDLVDPSDYSYRFLRSVFRSVATKMLVNLLPRTAVNFIGKNSSRYSRGRKTVRFDQLPANRQNDLRRRYRGFAEQKIVEGFDYVILGHCHDLDERSFKVGERTGFYFNVGYPRIHQSYLVWTSENSEMRRESFV